jgi:hypothetical protein
MRVWLLALVLLLMPRPAGAAAWLQPKDGWQVIASAIYTDARHSFGDGARPASPTLFQRGLLQTDTAYGWNDELTLFLRTETANVHVHDATSRQNALSNAVEAGARYRLGDSVLTDYDVISVEGMARAAGAFNFSVSANGHAGGEGGGIRLLYGAPLKLFGRDGFLDVEAGERWLTHPRPNETVLDLTMGLWLTPSTMLMLQSFNLVSGPARVPYVRFRTHKLQFSHVWRWSPRFSLQTGAYFSPAGANALEESGMVVSLWANF